MAFDPTIGGTIRDELRDLKHQRTSLKPPIFDSGPGNIERRAPKVPKCLQNGGPELDFLTFFEAAPNDSGIAQVYSGDSLEVYLSSAV